MKKISTAFTGLVILVMTTTTLLAQSTLSKVWQTTRNFNNSDVGTKVKSYYDSNTEIHMISASIVNDYSSMNVTDRHSNGQIQWSATIDEQGYSYWTLNELLVDGSGNAYVGGSVYNSPEFRYEIFVIKINSLGAKEWANFYSDEENYLLFTGLAEGDNQSLYVSWWYVEYGVYGEISSEIELTKLNSSDGTTVWETEKVIDDLYVATNAMVVAASGIYLTGYSSNASFGYDVVTFAFDLNGNFLWETLYSAGNQSSYSTGWDIVVNSDGKIVVGALVDYNELVLIGYNPSGTQSFVHTKSFSNNSNLYNVQLEDDGNGSTYACTQASAGITYQIYIESLDNNGSQKWQKGITNDYLIRMKLDPVGQGVWVLSSFYDVNVNNYFFQMDGITSSGDSWLTYQFPNYKGYNAVADFSSSDGVSIFLTGSKPTAQFTTDELTARWDVVPLRLNASSDIVSARAYPNPCSDYATLQLSTEAESVFVYDVHGRLIDNYINLAEISEINTSGWNAGLYLLKVMSGSEQQMIRLVKE